MIECFGTALTITLPDAMREDLLDMGLPLFEARYGEVCEEYLGYWLDSSQNLSAAIDGVKAHNEPSSARELLLAILRKIESRCLTRYGGEHDVEISIMFGPVPFKEVAQWLNSPGELFTTAGDVINRHISELRHCQGMSDSELLQWLKACEWTDAGSQELLRLVKDYGSSMLTEALALSIVMGVEDGRRGF